MEFNAQDFPFAMIFLQITKEHQIWINPMFFGLNLLQLLVARSRTEAEQRALTNFTT